MATYKPAAHIADIRGHIQNTTYSRNRLGNFMKIRKGPLDRRTLPQLTRRTYMRQIVTLWNDILTPAQRQTWVDLSLLTIFMNSAGIQFHPSGFNLWIRAASFAYGTLLPIPDNAPDNAASPAPTFTMVATAGANVEITADAGWCAGKNGLCRFFVSPTLHNGRYSWSGPWLQTIDVLTATILAGLPNYVLCACPPSISENRLFIVAKGGYPDGVGNTITWPQFIPLEIQ
jgi:hypothetical protein